MKKIFLSLAVLFFCAQTVHAEHHWVWGNDKISVYVEDTELEWDDSGTEFSITVIDVMGNKFEKNRWNFYEREGNWFYGIVGKREIMPVSYANASGNILDFAENFW